MALFRSLVSPSRKNAPSAANGSWLPLVGSYKSAAGVAVNSATAMKVSVLFACITIPAEDVARADPVLYRQLPDTVLPDGRVRPGARLTVRDHPLAKLFLKPNRVQDWGQFAAFMERSMGLRSNAYAAILRDRNGEPVELLPFAPEKVVMLEAMDGSLFYQFTKTGLFEMALMRDEPIHIPARDVLHMSDLGFNMLMGASRIGFATDAIGLAMAQEQQAARWMAQAARPSVVLATDAILTDEAARRMHADWTEMNAGLQNVGKTAILEQGLKPVPLSISSVDLEFISARATQVDEICRFYRMPPHKVGKLDRSTNNNIAAQDLDYINNTLSPKIKRWVRRLAWQFGLHEQGLLVDFDLSDLFRADPSTRMTIGRQGVAGGILTQNEARRVYDPNLPPVEGGDTLLAPLNMAAAGSQVDGTAPDGAGAPAQGQDGLSKAISGQEVRQLPFGLIKANQSHDALGRFTSVGGDIASQFDDAMQDTASRRWVLIGKLSHVAKKNDIEAAIGINRPKPIDLDLWHSSIYSDEVRKTMRSHGTNAEYKRGQIPLTKADFGEIPTIMHDPDSVTAGGLTKGRQLPAVVLTKQIGGHTYTLVAEAQPKQKALAFHTMWKR